MIEVNVLTCKTQGLGLFFELTGRDYHPGSQNSASAYFASASGLIYLAIIKIFRDCNSNRLTILQRFSTLFNAFQRFSMLFNAFQCSFVLNFCQSGFAWCSWEGNHCWTLQRNLAQMSWPSCYMRIHAAISTRVQIAIVLRVL